MKTLKNLYLRWRIKNCKRKIVAIKEEILTNNSPELKRELKGLYHKRDNLIEKLYTV